MAFKAIWDTGATSCSITQNVVDACGLVPTGMTVVHGVHGAQTTETFLINLYLPNKVGIIGIRAAKGILGDTADILIGMDVITMGDFAITNKGGDTVFSFRVPSIARYDFVKEHNTSLRRNQIGRKGPPQRPRHR